MMHESGPGDWPLDVARGREDPEAFARLVVRFESMALASAYSRLGDFGLAEDATQEAFVEAYLHLDELREPYAFPQWLRRIVAKHCDRALRRKRLATVPVEVAALFAQDQAPPDRSAGVGERLHAAIAALPPAQRQAVALAYLADLDQATVAGLLGIPLSAVKARLRRARSGIRRTMMQSEETSPSHRAADAPESPVTRLFLALRSGDAARVRSMLANDPALANAEEDWDESEAAEYRLGFARHGTPLIRAIERDDIDMVRTLLAGGADVTQVCGCDAAEPALWTAAVHGRLEHAQALLAAGADPNVSAFRGATPLHVAAMRGDAAMVDLLLRSGAATRLDDERRTPAEWAALNAHADVAVRLGVAPAPEPPGDGKASGGEWIATGIKAIDLFAPLPAQGLVRIASQSGVGVSVFLAELSIRFRRRLGLPVIWTGFEQLPTDAGDLRHLLAESGAASDIELALVPRHLDPEARRERLRHVLQTARTAGPGLAVVFEEGGYLADTESVYGTLAFGGFLALAVSPIAQPDSAADGSSAPFLGRIAFSRALAEDGCFPAIDPEHSFMRSGQPGNLETAAAVSRAMLSGPDTPIRQQLRSYLTQPFFGTEPFTGRPGTWVDADDLAGDIASITSGHVTTAAKSLRFRGALSL